MGIAQSHSVAFNLIPERTFQSFHKFGFSLYSIYIMFTLILFKPPKGTPMMVDLSTNCFSNHSLIWFTL